jgi:hypothetical protein
MKAYGGDGGIAPHMFNLHTELKAGSNSYPVALPEVKHRESVNRRICESYKFSFLIDSL